MIPDKLLARLTQLPGARTLWNLLPVGSLETRLRYDIFDRPHYAHGVYSAADLARRLGVNAIQVIEFGVAGGKGLLALERIASLVEQKLGVKIAVCGFDTGEGMPTPSDYRDLPHVWDKGFYSMDVAKLRSSLQADTDLILGDVRMTIASWVPRAKIGFIAFDLDYYSS